MDEIGAYFEKRCTHCNVKKEYHINQVEAHESGLPKLLGASVGLLLMIFIRSLLGIKELLRILV